MLGSSVFAAAFTFGFRHGFDWDHIAALSDLTGSQRRPRRALALATLYALGHAAMVAVLGVLAIVFAAQVPDVVDSSIERVVGLSLVALGSWIAWTTIRTRAAPPPRSRWMLLIDLARRVLRRQRATEFVVIEHVHAHDHEHPLHEHGHEDGHVGIPGHPEAEQKRIRATTIATHARVHRHVVPAVRDPFTRYSGWSSFGIGVLHGIGAETPTQILIFAAAANSSHTMLSVGMLASFVVGLVSANTLIALASTLGFRAIARSRLVLGLLAAVAAGWSLFVGAALLAGRSDLLPPALGG